MLQAAEERTAHMALWLPLVRRCQPPVATGAGLPAPDQRTADQKTLFNKMNTARVMSPAWPEFHEPGCWDGLSGDVAHWALPTEPAQTHCAMRFAARFAQMYPPQAMTEYLGKAGAKLAAQSALVMKTPGAGSEGLHVHQIMTAHACAAVVCTCVLLIASCIAHRADCLNVV